MDTAHTHHHAHHVEHEHDDFGMHDHLFDHTHDHSHPEGTPNPHDGAFMDHEGHPHYPADSHEVEMAEHHAQVEPDVVVVTDTEPKKSRSLWYGE